MSLLIWKLWNQYSNIGDNLILRFSYLPTYYIIMNTMSLITFSYVSNYFTNIKVQLLFEKFVLMPTHNTSWHYPTSRITIPYRSSHHPHWAWGLMINPSVVLKTYNHYLIVLKEPSHSPPRCLWITKGLYYLNFLGYNWLEVLKLCCQNTEVYLSP